MYPQVVDGVVSRQLATCAAGAVVRAQPCVVFRRVAVGAIVASCVEIVRIPSGAWRGKVAVVVTWRDSGGWRQVPNVPRVYVP